MRVVNVGMRHVDLEWSEPQLVTVEGVVPRYQVGMAEYIEETNEIYFTMSYLKEHSKLESKINLGVYSGIFENGDISSIQLLTFCDGLINLACC